MMSDVILLVLGSLTEFTELVRKAENRGIRTVVVDANPGTEAKKYASRSYDTDIRDTEAVASIAKREGVTAITTSFSDLLLEEAVKIADRAGLPYHLKPEQIPYYRDKGVMKNTLLSLGLASPKGCVLHEPFDENELAGLHFPLVVKPLDLYGSRGICIAQTTEDVRNHFQKMTELYPDLHAMLAEEYHNGNEYNVQCWVRNGTVHVLGICDREKTEFIPGHIPFSTRNVYPSRSAEQILDKARNLLQKYAGAAGQMDGPLCMQCFADPVTGICVNEIAARFLGYEHELLEDACHVSLEDLLLMAAEKNDRAIETILDECRPLGDGYAAVLYFYAREGVLADLSAAKALCSHPAVRLSELFYHEGETIGPVGERPYFARYHIAAESREELERLSRELIEAMSAKDDQGNELIYGK